MIRFTAATTSAAFAGLAALTFMTASPAVADDVSANDTAQELSKGEARLAKMLEGREPGEPVNCIRSFGQQRMTTIDDTAYVYGRGRTIYVQRTQDPDGIDRNDVLVIRRTNGSQLCRYDIANTIEPVAGFFTGVVQFDEFVPYTRVEKTSHDAL